LANLPFFLSSHIDVHKNVALQI